MTSRTKILLIVGAGVAAFIGLFAIIFISVWSFTSGPADAGTALLEKIGRGDIQGAYDDTHPALKQKTSYEAFEGYMKAKGLTGYKDVFWSNRKIDNGQASIQGTIETAQRKYQGEMVLFKHGQNWRVAWFAVK